MAARKRCWWCGDNPLYIEYHDTEWGEPLHDDRALFELLTLEGFQAGLSWLTILKKREHFRSAFKNFDAKKIACFTARDVKRLMNDYRECKMFFGCSERMEKLRCLYLAIHRLQNPKTLPRSTQGLHPIHNPSV